MSDDKIFALVTVFVSGLFSLIVTVLTNITAAAKENKIFKRQLHKERIETTRTLYQDALFVLGVHAKQEGKADQNDLKELMKLRAKLPLLAPENIQTQFQKTAETLDAGLHELRLSQPEQMGDYKLIRSGAKYDEHEEEAYKLFEKHEEELRKLANLMSAHIKQLETEQP